MRGFRHFCLGYVKVRLTGLSPERFFNLCAGSGAEIWEVAYRGEDYEFCTGIRDFFTLGPYARKARVRLRIEKKLGLPFFLHKNRSRKLWAIGAASFFFLLYLLSLFVWDIDYQGNLMYTDDELGHFLETMDIRSGIRKNQVSCELLEEKLRTQYENITWVSARLSGTRLYIQVKENTVTLNIPQKDETPCDLVANADGTVTSIVVRSGIAKVKPGDQVEKGQILVSGHIPVTDDGGTEIDSYYVHSDADITAKVNRTETREFSVWRTREERTGRVRRGLSLEVPGHSFVWLIPDFKKRTWKTVTEDRMVSLWGDFVLPIHYGVITSYEVSPYEEQYTQTELEAMAEAYKNEISENLTQKGVQIIENNVKILVNGSVCRLEAHLLTEESIKEEAPAAVQEIPPEGADPGQVGL